MKITVEDEAKRISDLEKSIFDSLKIGDIVLAEGVGSKRYSWPMGEIEEIYFGKEGVCRVAKLMTTTGFLIRPLQKLYLLETGHEDTERKPEDQDDQLQNSENHDECQSIRQPEMRKSRYGRLLKKRIP